MPVHWWKPELRRGTGFRGHFGAELNGVLYRWLTGEDAEWVPAEVRGKALGSGSLVGAARPGDVVWGSGLNGDEELSANWADVNFRSVRGPMTRERLVEAGAEVPAVYGDPALLVRRFVEAPKERRGTLVLPHPADMEQLMEEWAHAPETMVWNAGATVEGTIAAINASARVVTSDLCALIVAEALGVPVVPMRMDAARSTFAFEDYRRGTGREPLAFVDGLAAALAAEAPAPAELPDELFDRILGSCPFEGVKSA